MTGKTYGPAFIIHGGAGLIADKTDETIAVRLIELGRIAKTAAKELIRGISAIDLVCAIVVELENCPLFNAGRGSVLTRSGSVEMDAAVMDGISGAFGAVGAVRGIKNPIVGARALLDRHHHLFLVGIRAEEYLKTLGLSFEPSDYFLTEERTLQLAKLQNNGEMKIDHDLPTGTVGAVVCDLQGNLAAATSTGGLVNKLDGRVGDSPMIGAGTWADNPTCAVSTTGNGEDLMRTAIAHEVHAGIAQGGLSLEEAVASAMNLLGSKQGSGGVIAIDRNGTIAFAHTTRGMYRAYLSPEGKIKTEV